MYEYHECGILIWNKMIEIDFTVFTYLLYFTLLCFALYFALFTLLYFALFYLLTYSMEHSPS